MSPPKLHEIYARRRLFKWLDDAKKRPVVWVEGPPGAGKTTLIANYLEQRRLPCLWYQLDADDNDAATFFHYLNRAAKSATRQRRPLPSLLPVHFASLRAFARRYFDELYRRLRTPHVLVLDNYQEVNDDSSLHEALSEAAERLPKGIRLIVISRAAPPTAWARNRMHDAMAIMEDSELRLNPDEAQGVAKLRKQDPGQRECVDKLHALAHGWMAGFILLLGRDHRQTTDTLEVADRQILFDYFAQEIFRKLDRETQLILAKSSVLPFMSTALVQQLAEESRAADILTDFHRRNYFVAHQAKTNMYQYHPLFRQFLSKHLTGALTPAERVRLNHRAARLVEKAGSIEEAMELYRHAYDWDSMTRLILSSAPALIQQSRHQTLARWIGQVPIAVVESEPWLLYWRGACRVLFAPVEARDDLARAYAAFDTRDDPAGMYLSWATIADSYFIEWNNCKSANAWVAAYKSLRERHPRFPSTEIETRVLVAAVPLFLHCQPDYPELPACVARAEQVLDSIADINVRILSSAMLHVYYLWYGRYDDAANYHVSLPADADIDPVSRVLHLCEEAIKHWACGDPRAAFHLIDEGLLILETHSVSSWGHQIMAQGVYASCACGDLERATHYLGLLSKYKLGRTQMDAALYHHLSAMVAWRQKDFSSAVTHTETSLRITEDAGVVFAHSNCSFLTAALAIARGERALGEEWLAYTRRLNQKMHSPWLDYMCCMGDAYLALEAQRHDECRTHLRQALAMSRERGVPSFPWFPHFVLARLYAVALEHDIEPDQARALIRKFGIVADDDVMLPDAWPFPVKVYSLGRFSVLIDDKPLKFSGKAQKKPLEMLKCLIALGGHGVAEANLSEWLWRDADGDAAAQALATTLHRLRRLIGENAIERGEGRLTLRPEYVWVDLWALEHALLQLENACRDVKHDGDIAQCGARIMSLYRGDFLHDESEASWAISARERVRGKLLRTIEVAAARLVEAGRYDAALALYQKGVEIDPLVEAFYQGLMRCYHHAGRRAEALTTYHRCRRELNRCLGIETSPPTELLYRQILAK